MCIRDRYQINPETLELGELLECEGSDVEYFEWNKQTKSIDEVDSNSLSDEEEEYFREKKKDNDDTYSPQKNQKHHIIKNSRKFIDRFFKIKK